MKASIALKDYPGGDRIKTLSSIEVAGKVVFVRVDFNVPQDKMGKITDDTRIKAALPTLEYLRGRGAKVICASHLGRPKHGKDPVFSLEPIASRLGELLSCDVIFADDCVGDAVVREARELRTGQIMVLENLRFHEGEEKNSSEFVAKLSKLCDIYVNDAFGTCHRAHASTAGLPALAKEKAAGFLLEKEIQALGKLVHNPDRPLISILGGSKVSDKAQVIEALMIKSSKILIGGAMAYTFLRAMKMDTGDSRVEGDLISLASKIMDRAKAANCEIVLPVDHICGKNFNEPGTPVVTEDAHIPKGMMGFDIGLKTQKLFIEKLKGAKSIFWNGPLGVFEKDDFSKGTFAIAQAIADSNAIHKICGGGDSVAAINKAGLEAGFTHISTGGGASLEMIQGESMPGIDALKYNPGK